jgi:hypothetical protein
VRGSTPVWVWKERRGLYVLCGGRVIGGVDIDVLGMGSDDEVTEPAAVVWCLII